MGSIMNVCKERTPWQNNFNLDHVCFAGEREKTASAINYDDALQQGFITSNTCGYVDGIPLIQVTNNSAHKIVLFRKKEIIGKMQDRLISISITLQHNATASIPMYFLSSAYFFDQGMVSIQQYLHYFNAADNLAGVIYEINGKVAGERYGKYPLDVTIAYSH